MHPFISDDTFSEWEKLSPPGLNTPNKLTITLFKSSLGLFQSSLNKDLCQLPTTVKTRQNTNQGIRKVIYKIDKWPRNDFFKGNGISELKKIGQYIKTPQETEFCNK